MRLMSVTTLEPTQAPDSPRRLAQLALANGFDVLVSESRQKGAAPGAKAWAVVGAQETSSKRFQAYWASTEAGGCKSVGQIIDEGKGARPVKSRELSAWITA